MQDLDIGYLKELRHSLHQIPEIANKEENTANTILKVLKRFDPDEIITNIGGYGIAATYRGSTSGPSVMLRCELDGLPIQENNDFHYRSKHSGNGHLCGHDGHMAILIGVASVLQHTQLEQGSITLLFQPAEETGQGAQQIIKDDKFSSIRPDYIFGLHNLPGFQKGSILIRKGVFASASKGIIIKLKGKPTHASHPENGVNPSFAISQLIQSLFMIPQMHTEFSHPSLITPIHISVGKPAFGTSASDAVLMATLRTNRDQEMQILTKKIETLVQHSATAYSLKADISYTEIFESVKNDDLCTDLIEQSALELDYPIQKMEFAFPWSEDFGVFTSTCKGAFFGIGSGENQPQLHNENYDFPDDLITPGAQILHKISTSILEKETI